MDTPKFIFLCGTPSVFFLSLFLLCVFWKWEFVRLAGIYAILPVLNWTVIFLISSWIDFKQVVMVSAVWDFVFIVPLVYIFRNLYKTRFVVPWLLLIFEIFRFAWLILYGVSSRSKLTYFEADLYYFYYFVPFIVLLYCIFTRNKSQRVHQTTS